LGLFWIKKVII